MANFVTLEAAASFGTGWIQVDQYQKEILDLVRRAGVLGQRIPRVPATGAMSRWFDQTAIGAAAFDTRDALNPNATGPTRVEKSLLIKAITNRVQFGLFNRDVAKIGDNYDLKAKDLMDMMNGIIVLHDKAIWTGTDNVSGSQVGAGDTLQYVSIPKQISTTSVTIKNGESIVDELRKQVAKLVADADFNLLPSAIYMNPLAHFALEQEMKQNNNNTIAQVEVVPGVKVPGLMTAAGLLPVVPDPFLATNPSWATAAPTGETNYPFVILTESLLEYHYVGSPTPRMFQLGTTSNLNEDYVGVLFGAPVVKKGDKAHVRGVIQRKTY